MKRYPLDSAVVAAYLNGRTAAVNLVSPWIASEEAATSILVYGEIVEYLKSLPDFPAWQQALRTLLRVINPYFLTYAILERYADIRRALGPPHGPGLIGDIDTLIAATGLQHNLIVVTTDSDFSRVPGLKAKVLDLKS